MQLTWLIGAPIRAVSVHRRACGRRGLGSSATQLMRAVSWHDKAGVSPPGGSEHGPRCRADSGRHPAGFVVELGSTKVGWLTCAWSAQGPSSQTGLLAVVVGEQSRSMVSGAHAAVKVAGPHAAQRRVVVGARAGGLLEVTRRLVGWCWRPWSSGQRSRRTALCGRSTRPV